MKVCKIVRLFFAATLLLTTGGVLSAQTENRPRARDLGIKIGVLPPGPRNAITDVAGVKVGQTTIIRGDNLRTGVTAIVPHGGNLYKERVPGAVFLGNAYGKLAGSTQVNEMGEIEAPILLTSTDSVPRVADAVISYMFSLKGNENVLSVNPVVGETNDGWLSDIRARAITADDVISAITNASDGPVEEGAVGAGTGTVVFSWKGGIGTSSRRLPASLGRLHGGRAGANELRRQSDYCGSSGGERTGAVLSEDFFFGKCRWWGWAGDSRWFMHDCGGDRRASGSPQPEQAGGTSDDGPGADGIE